MQDGPGRFELYRQPPEPEHCSFCGQADDDDDLLFFDGDDPEDPGTAISVCDSCQAWAYRTQLAAGYAAEDN
jgi:hypothetical protein